jgi:hypothetical protein
LEREGAVAVTTARLVAAVAGTAVLGAVAGFGAGRLTQSEPGLDNASPAPMAAAPMVPSPSPPPLPKKTPVPDGTSKLDPDELSYHTVEFQVTKMPHPPVRVTLRVPDGWKMSRPRESTDEVKFTDPTGKRWIRVESGFLIESSPAASMDILRRNLLASQPPENDLRILSQRPGSLTGRDGEPRNIATLDYTYIPNQSVRHVLVRWIGFGATGDVAVEMTVTGLPQDTDGLLEILRRASESVERHD